MSYLDVASGQVVAEQSGASRAKFIRKTYAHVAGALAAFVLLESYLISIGLGEKAMGLLATSKWSWLIVLGAFMGVSYIANNWAHSGASRGLQYAGLGLFVVAESLIFLPLITMATLVAPGVLENAALITGALVLGITAVVFTTQKDFSFIGPALAMGGMVALGIIIAGIVFGFKLGMFFSAVMVIFAGGCVLYNTSSLLHQYHEEQYVAASLSLFSSIALMFWYVVQFLMHMGND